MDPPLGCVAPWQKFLAFYATENLSPGSIGSNARIVSRVPRRPFPKDWVALFRLKKYIVRRDHADRSMWRDGCM
jgi:hypothetical protein